MEYQYYEFLALDRPLEKSEIAALRAVSSRADITSTRFSNVYNFGNLKDSPAKLMEKYFDAHVYVANWGTRTLMLRLPRGSVDEKMLAQCVVSDCFKFWTTKSHLLLQWERSTEEPDDEWTEGEGWMARLTPLREELERGDYRALYLGWLTGVQWSFPGDLVDDDLSDDEDMAYEMSGGVKPDDIEPPLPVGLGSLTAAQKALVEFLDLSPDLVAAAATASVDATSPRDTSKEMAKWVAQVAADDARKYLLLILQGEARQAEQLLRRAYTETQRASSSLGKAADNRRSVAEIRQLIGKARVERRAREAKRKQKELEKKRQERERYLTTLAQDVEKQWKQVGKLAEQQIASTYDRARDLLVDLSDAATLTNTRTDFMQRFRQFQTVHGRRSALKQRLEKAKLLG
ncbi:MAG: hypothetical protein HOP18_26040 [Deltaproteobacteria bacterium]|nr:hypothetical protein [Deltaproteobacteria bacterium]